MCYYESIDFGKAFGNSSVKQINEWAPLSKVETEKIFLNFIKIYVIFTANMLNGEL